uniref:Uncharacterized protein n=1 Tax=Trichuris muris TaxID=70415 RepID=A0A5S6R381_TRIMR
MTEANGRGDSVSGGQPFARYFPERASDNEFDLECGTADALELLTEDCWISQKLCGGQQEDSLTWPPIVPVKQTEPNYRSKVCRWSTAKLPKLALRNRFLTCRSTGRSPAMSMHNERLLAESLCDQSPSVVNFPNLGNCLGVFEDPSNAGFVTAAFATGSQAKTLALGLFKVSNDQRDLLTLEQVSAVDWKFDSEIVQVELLEKLDQPCCLLRLAQPPRAILLWLHTDLGRTYHSKPFVDQALHVGFSPHVAGEYFAVTPSRVQVGSLVSPKTVNVDLSISEHNSFSFGDWSGSPNCIIVGGSDGLAIWDMRCGSNANSSLVKENVSCLHCLHDDRTFLLYATETTVKLIDVRMPAATIIQWKHMLLGSPKYIASVHLDNHRLGRVREVIVLGRETNDATAFALLQPSENDSLFCGLHPPKVCCSVEDFLLWQQAHRPMVPTLPQSLRERLLAPARGLRALRQGILIANDVGDLYFQNTICQACNSDIYSKAFAFWNSCFSYSISDEDLNGFYSQSPKEKILNYPSSLTTACKGDISLGNFLSRSEDVQPGVLEEQLDKQWLEESAADNSLGDFISSCFVDQY